MADSDTKEPQPLDAFAPLKDGPEAVRRIIERVLRLEQEHLYQKQPRLSDDVLRAIKEEVR